MILIDYGFQKINVDGVNKLVLITLELVSMEVRCGALKRITSGNRSQREKGYILPLRSN